MENRLLYVRSRFGLRLYLARTGSRSGMGALGWFSLGTLSWPVAVSLSLLSSATSSICSSLSSISSWLSSVLLLGSAPSSSGGNKTSCSLSCLLVQLLVLKLFVHRCLVQLLLLLLLRGRRCAWLSSSINMGTWWASSMAMPGLHSKAGPPFPIRGWFSAVATASTVLSSYDAVRNWKFGPLLPRDLASCC